ncbi:hypothetical protein [Edaphovirga cremea]|uniref:hypothetical protein n=1 Tax=Edaphovirga cremea TaxID=2267246 RepID=UPI003988B20C
MCEQKYLETVDALEKIAVLASAASYLHVGEEEEGLAFELIGIILKTARRCTDVEVRHA